MELYLVIAVAFIKCTQAAVSWDSQCGVTKGCFPDCSSSSCSYLVKWEVPSGTDAVQFEILAEESGTAWVGVGFSSDTSMGADSGVACLTSNNDVISFYNTGTSSSQLSSPNLGISSTSVSQTSGVIACSFVRDNTANPDAQYYDLNNDYYLFLGIGPLAGNTMSKHSSIPYISSKIVDFQSTEIIGRAKLSNLIKLHACTTVVAWMLFSSIGIGIARYQKKMLKEKEVFGAKIWFQLHRLSMMLGLIFTIIGFIAIFVEICEYSEISVEDSEYHLKAHPILGIIITCLTIINPTLAIIRPNPDHKYRFIFNWVHRLVGLFAHILAIITVFFGYDLNRVDDVPESAKHASYAHISLHGVLIILLEITKWWIHFKEDGESKAQELLPQILMVLHVLAMLSTSLAVIIIVGMT